MSMSPAVVVTLLYAVMIAALIIAPMKLGSVGTQQLALWLLPISLSLYHCTFLIWEQDIFWQLRAGNELLLTGEMPYEDEWSYTSRGRAWLNVQWLSTVLLALAHRLICRGADHFGPLILVRAAMCAGLLAQVGHVGMLAADAYSEAAAPPSEHAAAVPASAASPADAGWAGALPNRLLPFTWRRVASGDASAAATAAALGSERARVARRVAAMAVVQVCVFYASLHRLQLRSETLCFCTFAAIWQAWLSPSLSARARAACGVLCVLLSGQLHAGVQPFAIGAAVCCVLALPAAPRSLRARLGWACGTAACWLATPYRERLARLQWIHLRYAHFNTLENPDHEALGAAHWAAGWPRYACALALLAALGGVGLLVAPPRAAAAAAAAAAAPAEAPRAAAFGGAGLQLLALGVLGAMSVDRVRCAPYLAIFAVPLAVHALCWLLDAAALALDDCKLVSLAGRRPARGGGGDGDEASGDEARALPAALSAVVSAPKRPAPDPPAGAPDVDRAREQQIAADRETCMLISVSVGAVCIGFLTVVLQLALGVIALEERKDFKLAGLAGAPLARRVLAEFDATVPRACAERLVREPPSVLRLTRVLWSLGLEPLIRNEADGLAFAWGDDAAAGRLRGGPGGAMGARAFAGCQPYAEQRLAWWTQGQAIAAVARWVARLGHDVAGRGLAPGSFPIGCVDFLRNASGLPRAGGELSFANAALTWSASAASAAGVAEAVGSDAPLAKGALPPSRQPAPASPSSFVEANLYHGFTYGHYLSWNNPEWPVFADTREVMFHWLQPRVTAAYGSPRELDANRRRWAVRANLAPMPRTEFVPQLGGWRDLIEEYAPRQDWPLVCFDHVATLQLERARPAHAEIIARHEYVHLRPYLPPAHFAFRARRGGEHAAADAALDAVWLDELERCRRALPEHAWCRAAEAAWVRARHPTDRELVGLALLRLVELPAAATLAHQRAWLQEEATLLHALERALLAQDAAQDDAPP